MLGHKLRRLGILAAPPAALTLMATSAAMAQYPYGTSTFDTSSSISTVASYNPPPIITRLDGYGTYAAASTGWSNAADHTGNGGGSIMDSVTWKPAVANAVPFTMDITNATAVPVSMISFYIMLAPGSATSSTGAGASAGYMQPVIRDSGYTFTNVPDVIVNGVDQGSNGWNFGDPTYSGTSDAGTWEFIQIPITPAEQAISADGGTALNVRAITLQDYNDNSSGRKISGTDTWYIDDLTLTPEVAVPEPATLGLLGLAVPALLARRRKHA